MTTEFTPVWRRSSFSGSGGTGGGNCVEAALQPGGRCALRDGKSTGSGVLTLPRTSLTALVRHVAR